MRNIYLFEHKEFSFPELNVSTSSKERSLFSVDPNLGRLFVYSDGGVWELSLNDNASQTLLNISNHYNCKDSEPSLVGLCYLSVTDSLCVALDNGDLLNISLGSDTEVECVGCMQSGIKVMEWSPDQDVVVLVTSNDTVITMSGTYDIINESDLQQQNFGENQFITVGWGKKETQFHGSEGKAAAKIMICDQPAVNLVNDTGLPQVCWRGDGSLFAVNCLSRDSNQRLVRIFNRQGDLQYTSEVIPGLESSISWRPSGNLIACTQQMPNKYVVCFLEKNGLKHGDFTLPFPIHSAHVRQLLWNADSSMLLAWCEGTEKSSLPGLSDGQNCLLLWTINNYHWYLKQRIDLNSTPVAVVWDQLSGSRLHVLCLGALYISYEFSWRVDHSRGFHQNDGAYVAVIDGDAILLTSFRQSVIPPPMSGSVLKLPTQVSEIMFAPGMTSLVNLKSPEAESSCLLNSSTAEDSGYGETVESLSSNSNNFCVVLSNGLVSAFSHVGGSHSVNPSHICIGSYQLKWDCEADEVPHHQLHHWSWVSKDTMMCSATEGSSSYLCVVDMESIGSSENGHITVRKKLPLSSSVLAIISGGNGHRALIQLSDETLLQYSFVDSCLVPLMSLHQQATQIMLCNVEDLSGNMVEMVVCLTGHNRLYIDGFLVKNNVTSVTLHSQFLLITTSQHQLICYPLKKSSILDPNRSLDNTQNEIELTVASRRVERGSRLVVAVPESNRVILQMPRGNLESIQPRSLSLYQLAAFLNSALYKEAFDLARKQRINLNLIIDHDPKLFMQNAAHFVKRVGNAQWLSLFLTELDEDDCTVSMYKDHYSQPRDSLKDKVHTVCDGILSAIEKQLHKWTSSSLVLPYITGLVRKNSSKDLEAALAIIKNLKLEDSKEAAAVSWTHALRHLLYLKDVDELMNAALGMYDFDLVLLVASRSQKDPKEYLAFLNNLQSMEVNYQRFSIDKHLRRWESALLHLTRSPEDHSAEFLEIVKAQDLFKTALQILSKSDERFQIVASSYAHKLQSQRSYKEAGVMFRRAADFKNALQAHLKALEWQDCIQDAEKLSLSDEEKKRVYRELCSALVDHNRWSDAAFILDIYLKEPKEAIETLCLGSQWKGAELLAIHRGCNNLILDTIISSAVESSEKLALTIKSAQQQFVLHTDRLKEVRAEKEKARQKQCLYDCDPRGESDLFSDTSSVISGSSVSSRSSNQTSSSNRSCKNRRKQERKVLSLKNGSRFEELALMRSLHQEISDMFALRGDVYSVNCFLLDYELENSAHKLQEELSYTLKLMESSCQEIWLPKLAVGGSSETPLTQGLFSTSNMIAQTVSSGSANEVELSLLEPQYRFPPIIRPVSWEISLLKASR